ncbi:MAG: alpha-galactosidase [Ilumatobacteraceae bacterium]
MIEHLSGGDTSLVIDTSFGVPVIRHWGRRIEGAVTADRWPDSSARPGSVDVTPPIAVIPMHGDGFPGRPGLAGHRRGGRVWSPRFVPDSVTRGESTITVVARDAVAELELSTTFTMRSDGVIVVAVALRNDGDSPYMLDAFGPTIPLEDSAVELGVLSGRWAGEFRFHRFDWPMGAWTAENRLGRTSHEHPPFVWAASRDASEWSGDVWGLHLAWSGNHVVYAERLVDGRRYVQLGELFHPGEMCVYPGESIAAPDVVLVHSSSGFGPASWGFHAEARRRLPRTLGPRPVLLNTWEAVYFDHDQAKLRRLAELAAQVGIERFVLDDGWFGSRRSDRSGLGDWFVSSDVYPEGLAPLIAHVRGLGMEFGIWVEPEMANPDSDVLRDHPDWVLATEGYEPVLGRRQVVLDLTRADVFDHVRDRLDALLSGHDISFVKWDMNRPLVQASNVDGKAAAHDQTLAVYRLFDEIRRRHPGVEFESCSSGGGRIDFGIVSRVERFWTSDNNDPVARQRIQRGASLFLPPEIMGTHVGPSPAHTTGRETSIVFRAITAFFGHMGVEADLTSMTDADRAELATAIRHHQSLRHLLHGGRSMRLESPDGTVVNGVVSVDGREAVVACAWVSADVPPFAVRVPFVAADLRVRVLLASGPVDVEFGPECDLVFPAGASETAVLVHLSAS